MTAVAAQRSAVIDRRYNLASTAAKARSRHGRFGAHCTALPTRKPFPIRPDVRLRSAGRARRHRKPGASFRFPVRRTFAPHSSVTSRLFRPCFSPFPFVCHKKFLSSDFPVASLRRSHLEDFHFSTRAESPVLVKGGSSAPTLDVRLPVSAVLAIVAVGLWPTRR